MTNVDPFQVKNATPSEVEVEAVVRHLLPLKPGGHTHHRVDHLKTVATGGIPWRELEYPPPLRT